MRVWSEAMRTGASLRGRALSSKSGAARPNQFVQDDALAAERQFAQPVRRIERRKGAQHPVDLIARMAERQQ